MAISQIINVVVNSKGAVTVAKQLGAIGDSAKSTTTYLNGLRGILAAALTFSGAGQITETINSFITLQNRLRQVADANNTVSDSWERLLQIANSSYSSIDSTVDLYFRVAQAYKAWGESAEAAYQFTDLFQKAAVLSGSSVQTTAQAVYQFSQALNKGKLDGDEFRSVLEGLPYVATLIQKSLGVTRAELYELSASGKISVDQIKKAFEDAAGVIQTDWANITPTIAMALVVLKNNWTDFVGSIETSTGVFSYFAQLILLVANNLTLFLIILAPVGVSLAFLAGRLALGLVVTGLMDMSKALRIATAAQWLFNAAVTANPITLIIIAIVAVIAVIIIFRKELGITDEMLQVLGETAVNVFTTYIEYCKSVIQVMKDILGGAYLIGQYLRGAFDATVKAVFSAMSTAIKTVYDWIMRVITAIQTAINTLKTFLGMGGGKGASMASGAYYGASFKAGEGFAKGGAFNVGGTGAGRDMTPVNFRAQRGERVTVETKKQQRAADNNSAAPEVTVPVTVQNYVDPNMMITAMETSAGQRAFVNNVKATREELIAILGVS